MAPNGENAAATRVSAAYIWQLCKGVRDNPTKRHLEALADFLGVPPSYYFDEDDARPVDTELELLAAMRDAGVRLVALRASGLSPRSLAAITSMIEHARRIEGLSAGVPTTDRDSGFDRPRGSATRRRSANSGPARAGFCPRP